MVDMSTAEPASARPAPDHDQSLKQAEALLKQQRFGPCFDRLESFLAERADLEPSTDSESRAERDPAVPGVPRALFLQAVASRYLKRFDIARERLDRLLARAPEYGRGWQELGHVHRDQQQAEPAARAYERATELNPGLKAAWRFLAVHRRQLGELEPARVAEANFKRLDGLPAELVSVTSMLHEGQIYKAERLCRHFLKQHPHHLEAMRLLAAIGTRLHIYDDAEFLLESALELEPGFDLARMDYVKVLNKRQKYARAHEEAVELRRRLPGNLAAELAYANQCSAIGEHQQALEILDGLIEKSPHPSNVHMLRGHAHKTIGNHGHAVAAYREAIRLRPELGDAWWSLANMKTFRFESSEIERMEQMLESERLTPTDELHLCFAYGKAMEDKDDYEAAFNHYARGNRIKRSEVNYSADRMRADFDRQIQFFDADRARSLERHGDSSDDPVFIVGLPRAGSTLVEQILASHPRIDGTLELPNILAMAHRLNGRRHRDEEPRYPAVLDDLEPERLRALGAQYIEETRIHREQAPHFLDKMPNNFRHIGLILSILPNARIIDARRSAMACCFSGFKQLFAEGQEFTYSLDDIGRYYRDYTELMAHWHRVYPGRILQVDYESVVDDVEHQVRRMLDFVDLEFDPACLAFHENRRSVRTASSEQVRQPIYRSGVEQWRHFEPWLDPLKEALGPEWVPDD
jgi:tetratricopeptide (TPR) repeat protein